MEVGNDGGIPLLESWPITTEALITFRDLALTGERDIDYRWGVLFFALIFSRQQWWRYQKTKENNLDFGDDVEKKTITYIYICIYY